MGSRRYRLAICTSSHCIPNTYSSHPSQYLVYCGWLIIELVFVVTCIVETRGRTLEETAALFDGEQPPRDLVQMGGHAATQSMGRANAQRLREEREEKDAPQESFLEMQRISIHGSADDLSAHVSSHGSKDTASGRLFPIEEYHAV